jgi:hypothetical protein
MSSLAGLFRRSALASAVVLMSAGLVPAVASAATVSHGAWTCTGGSVAPGTYASITVTGICNVDSGNVTVRGDVTIRTGGGLNAGFGGSNISIGHDLVVLRNGLLVLGCEPNFFICFNDPDQTVGTFVTNDRVAGNLVSQSGMLVLAHHSWIGGSVIQQGGGGGVNCTTFPLGPNGPPAYSDYEDNVIRGDATVVGLRTCWAGFIRNRVGHDVVFSNNFMGDPDGNEVVSNKVGHNLFCFGNKPAAQIGDSMGALNDVEGQAYGQCRKLSVH